MAVLASNSPLHGLRGVMGGILFRVVGDKTVVSKHVPPRKNARNKRKSELQLLKLGRFAEAAAYAKEITRAWEPRCYYKQKAKEYGVSSAYTAAVTAFMREDVVVMEEAAAMRAEALKASEGQG